MAARVHFLRWLSSWLAPAPVATRRGSRRRWRVEIESLEDRNAPATFTVINTLNTGAGSLRAAITSSNATAGPNTINFNIPTSDPGFNATTGAFTINLATPLSPIAINAVTIDGLSEKTFISSTKAYPIVALNGAGAGASANGLEIDVNSVTVKGLNIQGFSGFGIVGDLGRTGININGNTIGTDVTGTSAAGNGTGIFIVGNATIGGTTAAARNVVSGNIRGVHASSLTTGVKIQGNFIGTDLNGTAAIGNQTGVILSGTLATLGGSSTARNVISGNTADGVLISGTSATNIQVSNNFIGIKNDLTGPLGNGGAGINLGPSVDLGEGAPSFDTIGGAVSTAKNVISGNAGPGILIREGAFGNLVQGNYIGTNALGTAAFANGDAGIALEDDGGTNTIGGTAAGVGNLISGNTAEGIRARESLAAVSNDLIQGNLVGTNAAGSAALPNGTGINVTTINLGSSTAFTIGGTTTAARNVISGNTGDGIFIFGAFNSGVRVQGNFIGINSAGSAKLANTGNGISIIDAGNNLIGGNVAGAGNVISGNTGAGIVVAGQNVASTGNVIQGNLIGTTPAGTAILNNGGNGITVGDPASTSPVTGLNIGGNTALARNTISGNTGDGIAVTSSLVSGVAIQGNFIGTSSAGTADLGNAGNGIRVTDAAGSFANNVLVGGADATLRNVVSGNTKSGVLINGSAQAIVVQGNFIGTDVNGTTALGNSDTGVTVSGTASGVTIGGATTGTRNVISSNAQDGILITSRGFSTPASVQGNIIGLNAAGTAKLANAGNGIQIINSAQNLVQGSSGVPNVISGNAKNGIFISGRFATGNTVRGNFIGTDVAGTVDLGNTLHGVFISNASNNTLGGSAVTNANVISGNDGHGVLIFGLTGNSNTLTGNLIGTNAAGTADLGNTGSGVFISGGANNVINGSTGGFTVISGNNQHGVVIAGSSASGNSINGALIGTNGAGTAAIANSASGVFITNAPSNTISGSVISGNAQHGVVIIGGFATGNRLTGNDIGADVNGTADLGNALFGIYVSNAPSNTIGDVGTQSFMTGTFGLGNIISGNNKDGIYLAGPGAIGNTITANFIGTDLAGSSALGNTGNGISLLGPSTEVRGNLISANTQSGVVIAGTYGTGTEMTGNYIGTDITGAADLGNAANGVFVSSGRNNTIGGFQVGFNSNITSFTQGTLSGGNLISGNNASGVLIANALASGNLVEGNYIGLNAHGEAALANATDGVRVDNARDNVIGGPSASLGNIISGNIGNGVNILGSLATGNDIENNYIGTNVSGTAALPNTQNGVLIAAPGNTVGGLIISHDEQGHPLPPEPAGNVISGNTGAGIRLESAAALTLIAANLIGTDHTGTVDLGNASIGIKINGAANVTVGGSDTAARNVISGNNSHAITLESGVAGAAIVGNFIGTTVNGNAALGNAGSGVLILGGSNNTVGGAGPDDGNIIANNGFFGISLGAGVGNAFLTNSIFANPSGAINESSGTNNGIVAPVLTTATRNSAGVTVNGSISGADGVYRVELFASAASAQAQRFLGFVNVTVSGGSATFNAGPFAVTAGEFLTATVTDPLNDTSKLSNVLTAP